MTKSEMYAQGLYQALEEVRPDDHDRVLDNFARILFDNGDSALMDKIGDAYTKLANAGNGITEMNVTFARETNVDKKLLQDLNEIAGGHTEMKKHINENLIGGVVIRAGDTLLDGSIRNSLDQLKRKIQEN